MTIGQQVTIPPIPHGSTIEKIIAGKLIEAFLAQGFWISVYDGEETTVRRSTDPAEIYAALASTDGDILNIGRVGNADRIGWVYLVWGNDHHLVSDHTTNPEIENVVDPICEWAEGQR